MYADEHRWQALDRYAPRLNVPEATPETGKNKPKGNKEASYERKRGARRNATANLHDRGNDEAGRPRDIRKIIFAAKGFVQVVSSHAQVGQQPAVIRCEERCRNKHNAKGRSRDGARVKLKVLPFAFEVNQPEKDACQYAGFPWHAERFHPNSVEFIRLQDRQTDGTDHSNSECDEGSRPGRVRDGKELGNGFFDASVYKGEECANAFGRLDFRRENILNRHLPIGAGRLGKGKL